jgi:hypothetical protein
VPNVLINPVVAGRLVTAGKTEVLNLPLNEGSGSTVYDQSGHRNNGTIYGASWVDDDRRGGKCLSFDGTDDYVNCGANPAILPATLTVTAWIKTTKTGSTALIAWNPGGSSPPLFGPWSGNKLLLYLSSTYPYNGRYWDNANVADGKWHHIAMSLPGSGQTDVSNARAYVDGAELSPGTTYTGVPQTAKTGVVIGGGTNPSAYWFEGLIAALCQYNRVLSADEISKLYQGKFAKMRTG